MHPAPSSFKKKIIIVALVLLSFGIALLGATGETGTSALGKSCNVSVVRITGSMAVSRKDATITVPAEGESSQYTPVTYADTVVELIEAAEADEDMKAILYIVNSDGGTTVSGEYIANAITRSTKPNVAVILERSLSASMMAIAPIQKIFASPYSSVGSIGITMSYFTEVEKNKKEGYSFVSLTSVPRKDVGNPALPASEDDLKYIRSILEEDQKTLVTQVAAARKKPVEQIQAVADGGYISVKKALEVGLVDALGDMTDAKKYLTEKIGEEVVLCEEQ
jgi:protease-4